MDTAQNEAFFDTLPVFEQFEGVALELVPQLPVDVGEKVLAGRMPGPP